jgi:hypothetical protein
MKDAPGIDVVTRMYDLADLPFLDQLLFSLVGQAGAEQLRVHLMLQRFSFDDVRALRGAVDGIRQLHSQFSLTLHNWDFPVPFDLSVPLLNWGLEVSLGRHVAFFEIHDCLYPHACAALLTRLRGTSAALAVGSAVLQPVWWWGDVIRPIPGHGGDHVSAPIFMIDATRMAARDRLFVSDGSATETAEFIRRVSTSYEVDLNLENQVLAVRRSPLGSLESP